MRLFHTIKPLPLVYLYLRKSIVPDIGLLYSIGMVKNKYRHPFICMIDPLRFFNFGLEVSYCFLCYTDGETQHFCCRRGGGTADVRLVRTLISIPVC